MTTQIVNGIHLPIRDTHFVEQIKKSRILYGRGTYQLDKILSGIRECKSLNIAIDVGANVGLWTRILSKNFKNVVAIEPIPENVDCMIYNTNDCNNVKIYSIAVNQVTGFLPMSFMDNVATASVTEFDKADLHVACKPLDDFNIQDVNFIKVDVEGYENNVIKSGEMTIRKYKPTIVVEQKKRTVKYDGYKLAAVETLQNWGMSIAWEMLGDYCLVWR